MYELRYDDHATHFLEHLPKILRKRIFDKLSETRPHPHRFFERLSGRKDFKLRVGDYRIIADIDDTNKPIEVTLIGQRKNIYD